MTNKKISEINKDLKKLVRVFNKTNILFKAKIDYKHIHKNENDLCITFFNRKTHNNACIDFYVFFSDEELEDKFKICEILLSNDSLVRKFLNDKYATTEAIERMLK